MKHKYFITNTCIDNMDMAIQFSVGLFSSCSTCVTVLCLHVHVLSRTYKSVEDCPKFPQSTCVCSNERDTGYCRRGNRRMDIITPLFPQHVSYHYLRHTSQGLYNFAPEFEVNLLLRQFLGKQSGSADFPLADMVQLLGKMPHRPLCPPTVRHPPHLQIQAFFQSQLQLWTMIVCQQAGMWGRVPPRHF